MNHLDDDAELYALGLLPLGARPDVEAHLAGCEPCRDRVASAEAASWQLAATLPVTASAPPVVPLRAPRWAGFAVAALFALAFGAQTVHAWVLASQLAGTDVALARVASAHFLHVSLDAPGLPAAKLLYARDGSWLYLIVAGGGRYALRATHGRATVALGDARSDGAVASLFVRSPGPLDGVVLTRDGVAVARAPLPR